MFTGRFFCLQGVDEIDGVKEPDALPMVFDGLDFESCCEAGLACSGATDRDHVLGLVDELASVQLPYGCFAGLA